MKILKILFIILVISSSFYFFSGNKADPDLWGHLKFGEDVFEDRKVSLYDVYSYSSEGKRWIGHEWLSELIFYLVFAFTGGVGLLALKVSIGLAIALLIYLSVSENTKSAILKLLFVILPLSVVSYGFATRPQIFTYLFFALTVFLINRFNTTSRSKWLYPFPFIFLLWCNLHGGFIAGLGVLLVYCLVKSFQKGISGSLILATLLSVAVTFINPYGPGLWSFLLGTLLVPRPHLEEWGKVALSLDFTDYFAMLFVTALGLLFAKRKRGAYEIIILFIGLYVSFLQRRHIALYAIIFSMYIPKYIDSFAGDTFMQFERKVSVKFLAPALLCLSIIFAYSAFFIGKTNPFRIEIPPERYPVNAVKFMRDNRISGNIFSFFDWAQMCIRELPEANKVFFDGRYMTVYDKDLIDGYFDVLYGKRDYKSFLKGYPETDIMLLHPSNPLAVKLSEEAGWVRIYSSYTAQVFLKDNKRNENIIERHRKGKLVFYPQEEPFYLE